MGLGGNLIWTGVLKALEQADGRKVVVCHKPRFSDLLVGRLFDGSVSLAEDVVFRHNPRLAFTPAQPKSLPVRLLDRAFALATRFEPIKKAIERAVFRAAQARAAKGGPRLAHVDMLIHSYAERQRGGRFIWKQGGHAAQVIAQGFGVTLHEPICELAFVPEEEAKAAALLTEMDLDRPFVAIEPDTNQDWFGNLRAWPMERWQRAVDHIRTQYPGLPIVQIGLPNARRVEGTVDLRGRTNFREAALVIRASTLFVGTEGGLMHAACAVGARALILWGGLTLPEFAGYPNRHRILCRYVACAPCGRLGWCDRDHICMTGITVDDAVQAMSDLLEEK